MCSRHLSGTTKVTSSTLWEWLGVEKSLFFLFFILLQKREILLVSFRGQLSNCWFLVDYKELLEVKWYNLDLSYHIPLREEQLMWLMENLEAIEPDFRREYDYGIEKASTGRFLLLLSWTSCSPRKWTHLWFKSREVGKSFPDSLARLIFSRPIFLSMSEWVRLALHHRPINFNLMSRCLRDKKVPM